MPRRGRDLLARWALALGPIPTYTALGMERDPSTATPAVCPLLPTAALRTMVHNPWSAVCRAYAGQPELERRSGCVDSQRRRIGQLKACSQSLVPSQRMVQYKRLCWVLGLLSNSTPPTLHRNQRLGESFFQSSSSYTQRLCPPPLPLARQRESRTRRGGEAQSRDRACVPRHRMRTSDLGGCGLLPVQKDHI